MELRMLDENGECRKEKEREKFLQEQRITSGDMVRQFSKIRWNLGEKVNAPEELPPQLVIRRFLLAFMRPFLAVFIGKIFSPTISESRRAGQRRSGTRASAASPSSCPLILHLAASALSLQPYMRAIFFSH